MSTFPCTTDPDVERFIPPLSEQLPFHPLAGIFPMLSSADLADLSVDIELCGQREPIVLLDSQILDGRNRYRACLFAGVEPITCEYKGDDPLQFVLSANLRRRHLSESQRALIAAKLANLPRGRNLPQHVPIGTCLDDSAAAVSVDQAASSLNVGRRSLLRARSVLKDPELTRAVEAGETSVAAAEREIKAAAAATFADGDTPLGPCDSTDCPIPHALVPLWNRAGEVLALRRPSHVPAIS